MKLLVKPDGTVRAIYDETIDLGVLGRPTITRASHVEPDDQGRWLADLTPVGGPVLGPFDRRSEALEAERDWLERHWLLAHRLNRPRFSSTSSPRPASGHPYLLHPQHTPRPAPPCPLPVRAGRGAGARRESGHRAGAEEESHHDPHPA